MARSPKARMSSSGPTTWSSLLHQFGIALLSGPAAALVEVLAAGTMEPRRGNEIPPGNSVEIRLDAAEQPAPLCLRHGAEPRDDDLRSLELHQVVQFDTTLAAPRCLAVQDRVAGRLGFM